MTNRCHRFVILVASALQQTCRFQREVGQYAVGPRPLEAHQRFENHRLCGQPAVVEGRAVHGVLTAHLIGEDGHLEALLHAADDVEIGKAGLDHDDVGALGDVELVGDPLVAEEHIACFNWASHEEMHDISAMAIRINDFLCGMFAAIDIRLVDFKLEFGRIWDGDYSRVILADEISPDNCRLWDVKTGQKLDKDVFRRDLGNLTDAYTEVARRLGVMPAAAPVKPTLIN